MLAEKIENAIAQQLDMLVEAYDDQQMIGDMLTYQNLDWDIDNVEVGYQRMGFPHDLGENVLCIPIGEIELYQLVKPMSKARADFLSRKTDYSFNEDGSVYAYMGYDCITLTNKGA